MQYDPSGGTIVYTRMRPMGAPASLPEAAVIRDVKTGQEHELPQPHKHFCRFSPDGRWIAGSEHDGSVVVCPADGGACPHREGDSGLADRLVGRRLARVLLRAPEGPEGRHDCGRLARMVPGSGWSSRSAAFDRSIYSSTYRSTDTSSGAVSTGPTRAVGRGHQVTLRRDLGVWAVAGVVIGDMLGSGIFFTPGELAAVADAPWQVYALWALAGGITLCGALTLAELASRVPQAGAPFHVIRESFGPFLAFATMWMQVWVAGPGSIAGVAIAFGEFVVRAGGGLERWSAPAWGVAGIAFFVGSTFSACAGAAARRSLLTASKIGGLLALVAGSLFVADAVATPGRHVRGADVRVCPARISSASSGSGSGRCSSRTTAGLTFRTSPAR